MYKVLEKEILPAFYDEGGRWMLMMKQSMIDVQPYFDSNRMADEYYRIMYDYVDKVAAREADSLIAAN